MGISLHLYTSMRLTSLASVAEAQEHRGDTSTEVKDPPPRGTHASEGARVVRCISGSNQKRGAKSCRRRGGQYVLLPTAAIATAASPAVPPFRKIAIPISEASGCDVATIPRVATTGERRPVNSMAVAVDPHAAAPRLAAPILDAMAAGAPIKRVRHGVLSARGNARRAE